MALRALASWNIREPRYRRRVPSMLSLPEGVDLLTIVRRQDLLSIVGEGDTRNVVRPGKAHDSGTSGAGYPLATPPNPRTERKTFTAQLLHPTIWQAFALASSNPRI